MSLLLLLNNLSRYANDSARMTVGKLRPPKLKAFSSNTLALPTQPSLASKRKAPPTNLRTSSSAHSSCDAEPQPQHASQATKFIGLRATNSSAISRLREGSFLSMKYRARQAAKCNGSSLWRCVIIGILCLVYSCSLGRRRLLIIRLGWRRCIVWG